MKIALTFGLVVGVLAVFVSGGGQSVSSQLGKEIWGLKVFKLIKLQSVKIHLKIYFKLTSQIPI